MKNRIEEKLDIHPSNLINFKKWILKNNGKKKFVARNINSIYFDNKNYSMYLDSEEGLCPRSKIRIRSYNSQNIYFLEKKVSNQNSRAKKTIKISNKQRLKMLSSGILDRNYGICFPKIHVSYKREYYEIFNIRVTIDTNIEYSLFNSKKKIKDKKIVAEIKAKNLNNQDFVNNFFYFPRIRFSKYCRGVSLIYCY